VLAMSSLVLILSEYEGLPLVLLEAQALGTPVSAPTWGPFAKRSTGPAAPGDPGG